MVSYPLRLKDPSRMSTKAISALVQSIMVFLPNLAKKDMPINVVTKLTDPTNAVMVLLSKVVPF